MKETNVTPQDILKKELPEARASISKWKRYVIDADKEVQEVKDIVKKYARMCDKLTEILIGSNPFRLTCSTCGTSFYVYLVTTNHMDDTEHIQNVAACFCPYCGERVVFVKEKK